MSFLAIVNVLPIMTPQWHTGNTLSSCAYMKKAVYEAYPKLENGESIYLVAYFSKGLLLYEMESNQETVFPQKGLIGTAHS